MKGHRLALQPDGRILHWTRMGMLVVALILIAVGAVVIVKDLLPGRSWIITALGLAAAFLLLGVWMLPWCVRRAGTWQSNKPALVAAATVVAGQVPDAASASESGSDHALADTDDLLVQRKDFRRDRIRPLCSRHGAYSLEQAGTDRLFILAGSAIGARHDQYGDAREDDVAYATGPSGTSAVFAAVADGVGSARLSHLASALAVRYVVTELPILLDAEPERGWQQIANQLIASLAEQLDEELVAGHVNDLGMPPVPTDNGQRPGRPATTLAVLAIDEKANGTCASWLTVGDCAVAVVSVATGEVEWLTPREYKDGTEAVPSRTKASLFGGPVCLDERQAVLAMSDGMADLLGSAPEPMLRALAAAQTHDSALRDLLLALDMRLHGNHDDRTVIAVGPIHRG